jgi:hypothetical protein
MRRNEVIQGVQTAWISVDEDFADVLKIFPVDGVPKLTFCDGNIELPLN